MKGKAKFKEDDKGRDEEMEASEKKKRSFERSLAGPSVGKAGTLREKQCFESEWN